MNKVVCIYDDSREADQAIQNIVGNKTFGDIILKRMSVKENFLLHVKQISLINEFYEIKNKGSIQYLIPQLKLMNEATIIIHAFSHFIISDEEKFNIIMQKSAFIKDSIAVHSSSPAILMFTSIKLYIDFLQKYEEMISLDKLIDNCSFDILSTDSLIDISNNLNFVKYISGGFDTRSFNSVKGNEYVVIKSSTDKSKIKAEYQYYHLIPEKMKMWFVMPFDYTESETHSSYSMERYNMTDLAIRWVHGAISLDEFDKLLLKIFYFINTRDQKKTTFIEYEDLAEDLYVKKLEKRVEKFKGYPLYTTIDKYVSIGTEYANFDAVIDEYKKTYNRMTKKSAFQNVSVIGHGDLCFSNILFNKELFLIKLIDPKGALTEEELWTDPYYDLAKISHSICGRYDFFNNGLYKIFLNNDLKFSLEIDYDNREYINLFRKYLNQNGFNYLQIRLYEVSLFLSMLPLHMDNPHKVFGFLLNAIDILKEVKENVR